MNATNALLQQSVPDAWRGRAVGLYSMSFAGTAPIGNIVTASLAEHIGLAATLSLNGALIVAAGLIARVSQKHTSMSFKWTIPIVGIS